MQKRWYIKESGTDTAIEEIRSTMKVDRITATLFLQRGIRSFEEAKSFLNPSLQDLHDPFLMKDMDHAVERLTRAIQGNEKILLFGDYDVDGTTAVALLYSFLKREGAQVDFYIPDRYTEGYGLSRKGLQEAADKDFRLVITLDCGIKSVDLIAEARTNDLDVIVCDHHTPGTTLPEAIVLDPKRADCPYPYKELSGCGVGFKLLQGYLQAQGREVSELFEWLDLLAISIGADIVEIRGENRILCYHGLKQLNAKPRTAFKDLVELAGRQFPVSLTDVVFIIAPRINAAGRLRSGRYAVELMISEDREEIRKLAEEINEDNKDRRALDEQITKEALAMIASEEEQGRCTTVVYKEDWHKGVVGIVASRLIEQHYRPSIVLTRSQGLITGSARSIEGIDLYDALLQCEDLLLQFGGHKHAAGLSMPEENLTAFKERFEQVISETYRKELFAEQVVVDLELALDEIYRPDENRTELPQVYRRIMGFEPHGPGNMRPLFLAKKLVCQDSRILKEKHLKLRVCHPNGSVALNAIGFNLAHKENESASGIPFDMVFSMENNRWRDRDELQLQIRDLREAEW